MSASAGLSPQTRGILLMAAVAFAIQIVDGLAKYLSADYSPLFIGWARYAVATIVVLPYAFARHGWHVFPSERLGAHMLRTILLVTAMTLYFVAITFIPLATAISAYFIAPIIGMVLSVLILKERMTSVKGISLVLGFAGAMVILQPGSTIDPGILLALASGLCFAFYMIVTRKAALESDPLKTLAFQCAFGALILLPQALFTWSTPAWSDLIFFAGVGIFSLIGHFMLIVAFRLAETSVLAPLVYLELVGAAIIGYLAFNEVPGPATIAGAALIVLAGLILLWQSKTIRVDEPVA
ncbi:DMT family transporter [Mesorhizobium sp. UC22_110]|uniref:DMT family transporter n=1 Tax=unclassified Mesorhizobium TaxID=325217 RepID=UPI00366CA758